MKSHKCQWGKPNINIINISLTIPSSFFFVGGEGRDDAKWPPEVVDTWAPDIDPTDVGDRKTTLGMSGFQGH